MDSYKVLLALLAPFLFCALPTKCAAAGNATSSPTLANTTSSPKLANTTSSPTVAITTKSPTPVSLLSTPTSSSIAFFTTTPNSLDTFSIDWTSVSQVPSLNAIEVTVAGTCGCDLTLNGCDTNCCCDPDCDQNAKALFTECTPEGPSAPSLDYCVPKAQVAKVNLHHSHSLAVVETTTPENGFLSKQLCIAHENNADLGQFFADPVPAVETDLATVASQLSAFSFGKTAVSAISTGGSSTFQVGDSVPAAYLVDGSGGLVPTAGGSLFALPAPALSAACEALQTVGFLVNIPSTSCQRISSSLADDCSSLFSSTRLVTWLRIVQTGASVPSQPSGYVSVTSGTVQSADASSGALASALLAPTAYDAASETCGNSLKEAAYTIVHDGRGSIISVTADLVLTNTTTDALTGVASLQQTFSLEWVKDGTQSKVRPKAGNPGYLDGYPVLAGQITKSSDGSKQAISQFTDGLPIPSADPDGLCNPDYVSSVLFGADGLTSCSVPLTQSQLAAFCQSTPASPLPIQLLGGLFGASSDDSYVATWASADATNVLDWQQVAVEGMTSAMTWDAASLTCHGVASGLKYEFLVSKVGARDNPQRQISFSRVTLVNSDWTFQDATQPDAAQNFVIQNTVKFLPRAQANAKTISPPPPPLLPSLPDDLFYPFFISSANVNAHLSWSRTLFMIVLVVLGCTLTL